MTLRQQAAAIATQFEGRCTCATMDGGVDCPWCQLYQHIAQGHPLTPPHTRPDDAPAQRLSRTAA